MTSQLKIGLVGLDTSHCLAFTRILQDSNYEYYLGGGSVTGVFSGGSLLFSLSRDRVQGFTEQLHGQYGIPMYDHIPDLVKDVDALMLLSADGRQHLEQFEQMAVGKPVFIDKPLATSTEDASQMIHLAEQTGTPILSCSSLRFAAGMTELLAPGEELVCCESFGPATVYPDYPGLFWYGVHAVDVLFSKLGPACQRVQAISHPTMDAVMGEWQAGQMGIFRGTRFLNNPFGFLMHTNQGATSCIAKDTPPFYFSLIQKVLEFFNTRQSPVSPAEMFAVIAFIEAAHQSFQKQGQWIDLVH